MDTKSLLIGCLATALLFSLVSATTSVEQPTQGDRFTLASPYPWSIVEAGEAAYLINQEDGMVFWLDEQNPMSRVKNVEPTLIHFTSD